MHLTRPRIFSQAAALGAVVVVLLICLAPALLARGSAQPVDVELPVWPGTTLLLKRGPSANCPTPFACAVMSAVQRPGLSIWLLTRSPDQRKTGWHKLLFLPSD